jgi:calcitonin receptor-like
MESGEWWRHPETNMTWSNYTQCVNIQDLEFRNTVNTISLSGLGISLFFMSISLFIFFYFRSLNCGRIKMHKNLFLSMSGNNIFWIIWYLCVLYQPDVWSNNPVWCRVLQVTKTYFMISTYSWMLCEGAYLQLLLMNTWGVKRWQLWTLIASGWGLPLLVITPYTVFRSLSSTENLKYICILTIYQQ